MPLIASSVETATNLIQNSLLLMQFALIVGKKGDFPKVCCGSKTSKKKVSAAAWSPTAATVGATWISFKFVRNC